MDDIQDIGRAVARGGPMDGKVLGPAAADSYEVVMADRTRWVYVLTNDRETLPDGSTGVVFFVAGRR